MRDYFVYYTGCINIGEVQLTERLYKHTNEYSTIIYFHIAIEIYTLLETFCIDKTDKNYKDINKSLQVYLNFYARNKNAKLHCKK